MIDTLDIDKEEKDGHIPTSPIEKKRFEVTSPAKQFLNLEDSLHRKRNDNEFMDNQFSAPSSGVKMVVKVDFYMDKIVPAVEASQMNDCTEDDPCHPVKDISVDKEIQCSDRNVVESEAVGRMGSSVSSQSLHDAHNDLADEKAGSVGAYDLKCTVFDSLLVTMDGDQVDPDSVLHDDLDRNGSSVCSFDSGVLDRSASMIANTSANVFELPSDRVSVSDNDSDGKGSFVSSIDNDSKAHAPESEVSNIQSEVTGSTGFPYSDVYTDCDGKSYSATSIDRGNVDTNGSVVNIISAEVTENRSSPSQEGGTIDSSTEDISSRKFMNDQRQYVDEQKYQGDPKLSGPDILSDPIANSGHIPYSGSISLRSDSSTTSARSFAFPMLQSEWNSSPVKMAKADRRRLRKHRGWRVGLLCCRF